MNIKPNLPAFAGNYCIKIEKGNYELSKQLANQMREVIKEKNEYELPESDRGERVAIPSRHNGDACLKEGNIILRTDYPQFSKSDYAIITSGFTRVYCQTHENRSILEDFTEKVRSVFDENAKTNGLIDLEA